MELRHKDLWNKVIYGTPDEALAAASSLNKLGKMSDFMFQTVFLAICYTNKEGQMTKKRRKHK